MQDLLNSIKPPDITPELFLATYITLLVLAAGLCLSIVFIIRAKKTPPDSPELCDRLTATPWDGRIALALLAVLLLSIVIGMIELQVIGLIAAGIYLQKKGIHLEDTFGLNRSGILKSAWLAVIYLITALPALVFFSIAYRTVLISLGIDIGYQDAIHLIIDPEEPAAVRIYIVTMAIIVAPVAEELLFRGILFPSIMKLMSPMRAVVIVSIFFALLHLHLASIVPLFILSISFCFAYIYSGNILVPIIMHMIFNAANIGLLLFLKDSLQLVE